MPTSVKPVSQDFLQHLEFDSLTVPINEQKVGTVHYTAAGNPKFINAFSISAGDTDNITIYNTTNRDNTESRTYPSGLLFSQILSTFFQDDATANNDYVTHPWTGAEVRRLHCISFNQHLYKDKLIGFNTDLLISITGDIANSENQLGTGSYDSAELLYTLGNQSLITNETYFGLSNNSQPTFPQLDKYGFDYSIVAGRVIQNVLADPFVYYVIRGVLLKDYGLIVFFDNPK